MARRMKMSITFEKPTSEIGKTNYYLHKETLMVAATKALELMNIDTSSVQIIFGYAGSTYNGVYTFRDRVAKIDYNKNDLSYVIYIICHELIHHVQHQNGKISERFYNRKLCRVWRETGKQDKIFYQTKNYMHYTNSPWEVEARLKGWEYSIKICESLGIEPIKKPHADMNELNEKRLKEKKERKV